MSEKHPTLVREDSPVYYAVDSSQYTILFYCFKNEKYRKAALTRISSSPNRLLTVLAYIHIEDTYMHLNTTLRKIPDIHSFIMKSSQCHSSELLSFSGRFTTFCIAKNRQQILLQTNIYLIRSFVF